MSDGTIVVTGYANCEEANHEFQQFGFNYGELSDEYTTGALISDTIAALPPYPGTFDGSCSASRNLSNDESCYTIQRFRYKFTYPLTLNPFVIHWVEKFVPDNGGPVITEYRCEPVSKNTTQSSVHELREPDSNGTITVEQISVETFDAEAHTSITPVPASSPFMTPPPCQWGATTAENLHIDISACSDGANWHAIVTALRGDYSTQRRLMPGWDSNPPTQQVTGIGGNTTEQYFCQQVSDLNDLVLTHCPSAWYMLEAVVAHENYHVETLLPFLQSAADKIVNETQQLSVPDSQQTQQDAISQIQNLPDFAVAQLDAYNAWGMPYQDQAEEDDKPGGMAKQKERDVVDPMINSICSYAIANNWQPPCPICSSPTPTATPTPTPTPTAPPAPTAAAATSVTSTGFIANWSSATGATGYRFDVSTSNSFTSYVSGYQDLDVGNVTSRSVNGLSKNTNYYYRVRSYNIGGVSGNSNVIHVKTTSH